MPTEPAQNPPPTVISIAKIQVADTIAASSGGAEWSSIIRPSSSEGCETRGKGQLLDLCSAVVKSETEILRHKESNKVFYNSFAVLASDYISNNASHLSSSQLEVVHSACRILLKYLIGALQYATTDVGQNTVQVERYIKAIRALCIGNDLFSQSEISVLINTMKGGSVPTHNNAVGGEKDVLVKQESAKNRTDLSVTIFEQLTMPPHDGNITTSEEPSTSQSDLNEAFISTDPTTEINKLFLKMNTESLQSMRAGDTLVDLCLSLPSIKRAKGKIDEALAGKPFSLPTTQAEATSVRNSYSLLSTLADVNLVSSAMNLPVLEPLTPSKLDKLCNIGMAVLYCAISQTAASAVLAMGTTISPKCPTVQPQAGFKEDELDTNANTLIEEVLNLYTYIGNTIKNSTRAGGHVYQNHLLSGAWVLISGLQAHVSTSIIPISEKVSHLREREEKSRSPSKVQRESSSSRSSLIKFQQSFAVLSVALATRALNILSELFDDLHLEVCGNGGSVVQVEPAPVTIMGQFSALQKVARLVGAAPLNQLLFYLALISYRKACSLKRIHPPEGDTFSQSDSTTYYEDMIMCSDESSTDEDDDSEPILGQWFEETLFPPETTETKTSTSNGAAQVKPTQSERLHSIVPEKGEGHGFIAFATNIFVFLNKHFLCSKSTYITRYVKTGLTEQQIMILAAIIRDLDRETARTDVGTISV